MNIASTLYCLKNLQLIFWSINKLREVSYLIEGSFEVNIEDNKFIMNAGDSVRIPPYTRHKFWNKTDKEAVLIFAITPPDF